MSEDIIKCPFCKSENIKFIKQYGILEKFDIDSQNKNQPNIWYPPIESKTYYLGKYFCRNCGHTFELMSRQNFEEYKNDEKYFKKDEE